MGVCHLSVRVPPRETGPSSPPLSLLCAVQWELICLGPWKMQYVERTYLKRKEVDDVLGGEDSWKNVDSTAGKPPYPVPVPRGQCPFSIAFLLLDRRFSSARTGGRMDADPPSLVSVSGKSRLPERVRFGPRLFYADPDPIRRRAEYDVLQVRFPFAACPCPCPSCRELSGTSRLVSSRLVRRQHLHERPRADVPVAQSGAATWSATTNGERTRKAAHSDFLSRSLDRFRIRLFGSSTPAPHPVVDITTHSDQTFTLETKGELKVTCESLESERERNGLTF